MTTDFPIEGDIVNCAEKVRRGDPDRFLAIMSTPLSERGALFIIYAFNLEISRAPWVTKEAMIAEMRLQWWLDAIDEIYAGGNVRRHDVVSPLEKLIKTRNLPRDLFDALIAARRWDIYKDPHENAFAFEDYILATSGNLMALACLAVGSDDNNTKAAREYGYGDGVARLLLAIPALENAQRYPLIDGRPSAVKSLAQLALVRMNKASFSNKRGNGALRTAWMARDILKAAIKTPEKVADDALESTAFSKKLKLLSKSFRNAY